MSNNETSDPQGLSQLSQDSHEIAQYYDDFAAQYAQTLAEWEYEAPAQIATRLAQLIPLDSLVLDVGCGTGLVGQALTAVGLQHIDGIDLSASSLELAAQLQVYRSLNEVDLQALPLPQADNKYDGAVCVGVLSYIADSHDLLRELCRVVRPGGAILLTHRTDHFDKQNYFAVVQTIADEGLWDVVEVTEPRPYLPKHAEFAEHILARHITGRVK